MSSSDKYISTCLLLGGGALTVFGQISLQATPLEQRGFFSFFLTLAGVIIFFLGAFTIKNERVPDWMKNILEKSTRWLDIQPWQIVGIIIAFLLSIVTHFAAGGALLMNNPIVAWASWLLAIGLIMASGWRKDEFNLRSKWKLFAIALGFTLLALPLRAIATGEIPVILNGDEASAGIYAISFLKGEVNNPFAAGWYSFPGLYFLFPATSISLLGNTTAALRIPSAIIGAITVGLTFLAGKIMFDKRTGMIAALALAGFHFHVHFSRIGLNNIWDGLFFILTVSTAWYAWEKESRNAALLTGLELGLAQYFYPGSRVILGVVYGAILFTGFFERERFKRLLSNIVLMTFTFLVVFLPLAWYYILFPEQYTAPLNRVSIIGPWLTNEMQLTGLPAWRILLKQTILGFESFTYLNLQHWYRPEVALLRPVAAGLFFLGLCFILLRYKSYRSSTTLLWLFMYVLIGGLSESTPAAQRYVGVAPICMLLVAHGLGETGNFIEKLWPKANRWITALLIAITLFIAVDDMNFYFNKYTPHTASEFEHTDGGVAEAMADYLIKMPKGTQAYFFAGPGMGYYSIPSIAYLVPQVEGIDVTVPWGAPEIPTPNSKRLVFIFIPVTIDKLPEIQALYPGGILKEKDAKDGQSMVWFYDYSAK
ncbi:MAG: glycosyltransferase family 39 protein [Anaerolineales bacterium]